jgi:hypothetical protein
VAVPEPPPAAPKLRPLQSVQVKRQAIADLIALVDKIEGEKGLHTKLAAFVKRGKDDKLDNFLSLVADIGVETTMTRLMESNAALTTHIDAMKKASGSQLPPRLDV